MEEYFVIELDQESIEKADKAGLIPIRKQLISPKGVTFYRTYWCKPKDIQSFKGTAPAVEYLHASIETQKDLMAMVQQLEQYNTGLAAEIYNQMIHNHEQSVRIADKLASISDWVTARETNLTTFLAAIKHLLTSKGSVDMGDITKTYEDISYQYKLSGLELKTVDDSGKEIPVKKMGVTTELVPMAWADKIKDVGSAIRDNIKAGLVTLRAVLSRLGKGTIPQQPEELDFRRKENAGKLGDLYVSYQPKLVVKEPKKKEETKVLLAPKEVTGILQTPLPDKKKEAQRKKAVKAYQTAIELFGSWEKTPAEEKKKLIKLLKG